MKKDPNSHRSKHWMKRNDFTTNQNCRAFLVKLVNKRTGAIKEYWKSEPYYDMCMDIVQS